MNYFRYKQFDKDVITVAVGYYLRYALSYRDISDKGIECIYGLYKKNRRSLQIYGFSPCRVISIMLAS